MLMLAEVGTKSEDILNVIYVLSNVNFALEDKQKYSRRK